MLASNRYVSHFCILLGPLFISHYFNQSIFQSINQMKRRKRRGYEILSLWFPFILVHYPNILEPRSGATVNHKIVSPLYKTKCRLLLVVIQYSPETSPALYIYPPKQNQSTENINILFRVF